MTPSVQFPSTHKWPTVLLLTLLSSCGGGGGGNPPPQPPPPPTSNPPPPPPPVVGSVEIEQTGLLLTETGQKRQLRARVIDTNGNPMTKTVTWTTTTGGSVNGARISVSADGLATANGNGIAQIVATADGVASLPLIGVVTPVAPDSILLTDAQIVGDPRSPDPNAAFDPGKSYDITLTDIATPAVGAILINTESKPVAGRVLAATANGVQSSVTLEVLPIPTLFPALEIREIIDLSQADLVVEDELRETYDIKRVGKNYVFVKKPGTQKLGRVAASKAEFECESDGGLNIDMPPVFSFSLDPKLDVQFGFNGLERLVVSLDPTFVAQIGLIGELGFNTSVTCELEVGTFRPRIGGAFSFLAGVTIPWGMGFKFENKVAAMSMELSAAWQSSAKLELGLDCPGGDECNHVNELSDLKQEFKPTLKIEGESIHVEPSVSVYLYENVEFELLAGFLDFQVLSAKVGLELGGSFGILNAQISDPKYAAEYGLKAIGSLSFADDLNDLVAIVFGNTIPLPDLISFEASIGRSPSGVVRADRANLVAGERVNFEIEIEGEYLVPLLRRVYNIERLLLIRRNGDAGTVVASIDATDDQRLFSMPYVPDVSGNTSDYYVFVVTSVLPFDEFAMKIGRAAANTVEIFHVYAVCTQLVEWTERTGFGGAHVRLFNDEICSGSSAPGRHYKACRYNGAWLPKHEGRSDIIHNTRQGLAGSYERDEFALTADGAFEIRYEFGWNETRETATQTITNYREQSMFVRANPDTEESGGRFYRKMDTSSVSKIPNQTGTYNVITLEADLAHGPHESPAQFRGRFFNDPTDSMPPRVAVQSVIGESEIPPECTGPTPYEYPD